MRKVLFVLACSLLFCACKEDSSLTVSNELENVVLQNVRWDDQFVATELLPGQSGELVLSPYTTDLPKAAVIQFEMIAANRRIGLRTVEVFEVEEQQDVRVEIDSALQVTVR
ncbi:MAG: hypothetical protein AAF849_19760 [Bacteroidota bacterium]